MSEQNAMDLKVGDTVYFVPSGKRCAPMTLHVQKIGRKWIEAGYGLNGRCAYRLDKTTLRADGGDYVSPGCAFRTEADYHAETNLRRAWQSFTRAVGKLYDPPPGVNVETIKQAAAILGLPEPPEA